MIRWDDYINPIDFLPATAHDYADWLFAYLDAGGEPTNFYDYPLPWGEFVIARRDVDILPRYGASSINVLVPAGVNATIIGTGHGNVYYLPDLAARSTRWLRNKLGSTPDHVGRDVPVYADPVLMQREDLRTGVLRAHEERRRVMERYQREREMRAARSHRLPALERSAGFTMPRPPAKFLPRMAPSTVGPTR